MKCNYCGFEKDGDCEFCPQCGTRLRLTYEAQPHPEQQYAPQQGQPQYPNQGYQQYPNQGQPQYPYQGYQQYPNQGQPQYPNQDYQQYQNQGQPQYQQFVPPQEQQYVPYNNGPAYQVMPTPTYVKVGNMLKSNLFLALCVLVSASALLNLLSSGLPIIRIILCIFLWTAYAKGSNNTYNSLHIQRLSGTAYASYIVNYVVAGLLFICGIMILSFSSNAEFIETVMEKIEYMYEYSEVFQSIEFVFMLVGIIFAAASVVAGIINFFGRRYIHRFLKSVYMSMSNPHITIQRSGAAKAWFIVFAVFSILGGLTAQNFMYALGDISIGAAWIIASIIVGKYLSDKQ